MPMTPAIAPRGRHPGYNDHAMNATIPLTEHSRALLEHREELLAEAKRGGLADVRVFGSMARGDADEDSDVDLLAQMDFSSAARGFARFGLAWLVEDLTGRKVDMVFEHQLDQDPDIRDNILADAVPL